MKIHKTILEGKIEIGEPTAYTNNTSQPRIYVRIGVTSKAGVTGTLNIDVADIQPLIIALYDALRAHTGPASTDDEYVPDAPLPADDSPDKRHVAAIMGHLTSGHR